MKCQWCGEPLMFTRRGWVHQEGGIYKIRCKTCGWTGAPYPTPTRCPRCGSEKIVDDHCALPRAE